ncbi:hypothetical protein [Micromonospora sp. NPDC092111]|uniref:hypothetical protein n=1 Tax=Micromonospora sp. NPDC092111 TaxID=3364289 RepID=UPI00382278FB
MGVRSQVQGEADPDYLDRPEVRRGLAAVADAGLVFDLVVRADQLPAAARAAAGQPGRGRAARAGRRPCRPRRATPYPVGRPTG